MVLEEQSKRTCTVCVLWWRKHTCTRRFVNQYAVSLACVSEDTYTWKSMPQNAVAPLGGSMHLPAVASLDRIATRSAASAAPAAPEGNAGRWMNGRQCVPHAARAHMGPCPFPSNPATGCVQAGGHGLGQNNHRLARRRSQPTSHHDTRRAGGPQEAKEGGQEVGMH